MRYLWLSALLLPAACGKPAGGVHLVGFTPLGPLDKDVRGAEPYCGACGSVVELGAKKCTSKKCGATLAWPSKVDCTFCAGSGTCRACSRLGQKDQTCYNCKGTGLLLFAGGSSTCPQCAGKKTCRICAGDPGKCDVCKGAKTLDQSRLQELAKRRSAPPPGP